MAEKKLTVEQARRIHDLRHEITSVALDVVGHDELWGCLRAAGAAMEQCAQIAHRDVQRPAPAPAQAPRKRQRETGPARGARAKGLVK